MYVGGDREGLIWQALLNDILGVRTLHEGLIIERHLWSNINCSRQKDPMHQGIVGNARGDVLCCMLLYHTPCAH